VNADPGRGCDTDPRRAHNHLGERRAAGDGGGIAKGWLWRHESGTYVKFTDAGAELFA
jgi:hypothetical protein